MMIRLAILVFGCTIVLSSCQQKPADTATSKTITPKDLLGKTIEYRYGESVYHVTLDSDSTMHWEAMAGDEKGVLEEETYIIQSVDHAKLFITWGEANGIGVAQVLDFDKGVVYNHLLRGRGLTMGKGDIKILE